MKQGRHAALTDMLSFIAAELGRPLTTVTGCIELVASRHLPPGPHTPLGLVQFTEHYPGELITALDRAQRRAALCQSLLATLVHSNGHAHSPTEPPQRTSAARLVQVLLDEFPFRAGERSCVVSEILHDFALPAESDLIYMVLCVLTRNALEALNRMAQPRLKIEAGRDEPARGTGWIRLSDNGCAGPPELFERPVSKTAFDGFSGDDGAGLVFCQRVMRFVGGSVDVQSTPGLGTTVTLEFQLDSSWDELGVGLAPLSFPP